MILLRGWINIWNLLIKIHPKKTDECRAKLPQTNDVEQLQGTNKMAPLDKLQNARILRKFSSFKS